MKQSILLTLLVGISFVGYSQAEARSEQKAHLGFNVGVNYSNLQSEEDPLSNNGAFSNALGYQLGIFLNYKLSERFSLNPRVEVVFNNGTVVFPSASNESFVHEVLPVGLDIMTYLTYKIARGRMGPYLLLGPDIKLPYLEKVRATNEYSSSTIVALDLGIGLDLAAKNYIFSPELRYSYGFSKLAIPLLKPFQFHSLSLVLNVK